MKRVFLIDLPPAVAETAVMLLPGDCEAVRRDGELPPRELAELAATAELIIMGEPSSEQAVALSRLPAAGTAGVLVLTETASRARELARGDPVVALVNPFNPYDFKAAIKRLLGRKPRLNARRGNVVPASRSYLEYPYLSRAAALLSRRFAPLKLPVLVWGEFGCGQDKVVRALIDQLSHHAPILSLNGAGVAADNLNRARFDQTLGSGAPDAPRIVLIEAVERLSLPAQSSLLGLLDELSGEHGPLRLFVTARADLLERVYRGEFIERLYYMLAKLSVPLKPLRERREDIPALANWFAAFYAGQLQLEAVTFTDRALTRLQDHLWFGNVEELDLVIARSVALHGRNRIDGPDLIFDLTRLPEGLLASESSPAADAPDANERLAAPHGAPQGLSANGAKSGGPAGLRILVHELAHELKNPMVTIKTFAQLLADRYDDAGFRARFQDVVDGDIGRMDDLLEVMVEFANFDQPVKTGFALREQLDGIVQELEAEAQKRQIRFNWKGRSAAVRISADPAQFRYAVKNTLMAVLSQSLPGSALDLSLGKTGSVMIAYSREGDRTASLNSYLDDPGAVQGGNIIPLRVLLAREIMERNGGRIGLDELRGERDIVTMEFPVV